MSFVFRRRNTTEQKKRTTAALCHNAPHTCRAPVRTPLRNASNHAMKQQDSYAKRRKVDLVVISDVHLGTYGCHAKALLQYMKSIDPKQVVLNGDIVDMWQFRKRYWPHAHMKVLKQIVSWAARGVEVHYITGNHDELLRKFTGFELGSLSIKNKLVLQLDNQKVWFFHGDVFDVTMQYSPWLTRLGAVGYDLLILKIGRAHV